MICAHLSWTVGGENSIVQRTSLEEGLGIAKRIFASASKTVPDSIHMVYGGPIKTPNRQLISIKTPVRSGISVDQALKEFLPRSSFGETTDKF